MTVVPASSGMQDVEKQQSLHDAALNGVAMLKELFTPRSHQGAVLVLLVFSLLLTQVPLFNYLGYEFSALLALFWSPVAGLLTISLWNKTSAGPSWNFPGFVRRSFFLSFLPLALPLIIILLNAFFVKNCSFVQGAVFFTLIVLPAVAFTVALATFIATWSARWKKTTFLFWWLVVLLQIAFVTFAKPQIFAFNPILGYFAGLTYDETLDVNARLLLYRLGTLAFSALLVLGASALDHRRRKDPAEGSAPHLRLVKRAVVSSLAALVVLMFVFSNQLGFSSSESYIGETLGGNIETAHFTISYPDTLLQGVRLEQVVQLHEFYYEQLVRTLRLRPIRKIHTFLYATPEQKGRLIGAAGTNIAKPWLWELHINLNDLDASLKHELVHVLAAEFGFPLIRVGVNSGLIEGLATAVERVEYEEPIHRLAALAYHADLAPDVESLFTISGFMRAPAGVSYVLAGSFCRYLIDRYGMRRFKMLYRTGEFTLLYGRPLPQLIDDWERFLTGFRFNGGDRAKAEYLFMRRSIFGKVCARVIANLNARTRELLSQKRYEESLASAEASLGLTLNVDAVYAKTTALVRMGRYREAVSFAEKIYADSSAAPSFLTLRVLFGDALWGLDSLGHAMKVYSELLRSHLSLAWDESLTLRLEILLKPELARTMKDYFIINLDDSARIARIEEAVNTRPREDLLKFFLARERIAKKEYDQAASLLESIPPLKSPILELSRQRRLGQLYYLLGEYERAKLHFWLSLNHVYRDAQSLEIEERLHLCNWLSSVAPGE